MTITYIRSSEWADSTVLWRYMDIYGILSLLTSNVLKFSNICSFEDGLEGKMPLQNSVIKLVAPPWEKADTIGSAKEKSAQSARIEKQRMNVWVTSWQAIEHECALMWRVYGSRQNGVAIKTRAHKLLSTLDDGYAYVAGPVRYIDYLKGWIPEKCDSAFTFYKQNGYRSEQEFRVAVRSEDQNVKTLEDPVLIPIKPNDLIEKIVISPWASKWQEKVLKRIINSLGYDENIVKISSVLNIQ